MSIPSKTPPTGSTEQSAADGRRGQIARQDEPSGRHPLASLGPTEESDPVSIFTADLHGVITSCSQGRDGDRNGFSPPELVGRNLADIYGVGHVSSSAERALASALESGKFEGEVHWRTKSGKDIHVGLRLTLLRDSHADAASIVGFAVDIIREKSPVPVGSAAGAVPLARREIDGTQFLIASPL
ncbi:MAG: PAS domain-containing protein, partial [Terriglobales bacterium]